MIIKLSDTNTREIAKQLVSVRDSGGQVTTGRVLTLIVVASEDDDLESIIKATHDASREHPSRVLIMVAGDPQGEPRVDAEIRFGGDAGASEIILMALHGEVAKHMEAVVTPLLLPDTPIVAWWPSQAPVNPAQDPIGHIAQRRITDALHDPPPDSIYLRRDHYTPGDSDMSWARITQWRGIVSSVIDEPPHQAVIDARVTGPALSPSVDLAAGWLADRLGTTITRETTDTTAIPVDEAGEPCIEVTQIDITRESSTITIDILDAHTLRVRVPGREPALVALNRRSRSDCLAEELRHLDPDRSYAKALRGLSRVQYIDAIAQ